jgi:tetratricopeptide (TPR) repeat protein
MKKQRKKRASHHGPAQGARPTGDLQSAARVELQAGRFREAIALYKDLLKREDSPQARQGLASAYAGRAGQLAEKGMLKEALVIWENRRQLGDDAPPSSAHATLLLRLGQVPAAAALYRQASRVEDVAGLAGIAQTLAAHVVAGDDQVAAALGPDDPIVSQGAAAREALAAYCRGDEERLTASLAAIPFRSPFRDWVQILKALQRLSDRPQEAAQLLARVGDASAFAPLRRAAELVLVPEPELAARLAGAGEAAARFALTLLGWGPERQALWLEAARLGPSPKPQALLRLLHRYRQRLGEDWARARALRLLVADFPRSAGWLAEAGGRPASAAERALVAAWQAEHRADPEGVEAAWRDYAAHLTRAGVPAPGTDDALRLALVQRRPERRSDRLRRAVVSGVSERPERVAAESLEASLVHDPDDIDTYLRLIDYHRAFKAYKDARRLLAAAQARWPSDIRILTAALDTALAVDAFKKAAGLARRILELDPINAGARERLVNAHINHARKQIRAGRLDLARRELAQAGEWAAGEALRERVELAAAFVTLGEDPAAGEAALRGHAERLGGGLAGAFVVAAEAAAVGRAPAPLLKALELARPRARGRDDLLDLLARLRAHLDRGERVPREVAGYLEKPLKAACDLALSVQEAESACETLRRCKLDQARQAFAKAALKRWPGAPRFELHAFEARHGGRYWNVSEAEIDRLERAIDRARAEGDMRTRHRLIEIVEEIDGLFLGPFGDLDALPDFPRDPGDVIANLIEAIGLDAFLDMIRLTPEVRRGLEEVERQVGREALIDMLRASLEGSLPDIPDLPPLPFGPPVRKPRAGNGKKTPRRTEDGDDFLDQLDLFR